MIKIYECAICRTLFKSAENALDCHSVDVKEIEVENLYHTDGTSLYVFKDDPNQQPIIIEVPPVV